MKTRVILALLSAAVLPAPLFAVTATSLGSFGAIEEPSVIIRAGGGLARGDTYRNITDQGGGRFRYLLRYHRGSWADGDRDTDRRNMQRAEVRILGPRQRRGETFTYSSVWRTSPGYRHATTNTCAVNQVKALDGDNGGALSTTFLNSDTAGRVAHGSAGASGMPTVRSFTFAHNTFMTLGIRIRISSAPGRTDGAFQVSINGSSYSGLTGVRMEKTGSTQYHPKWGLYRSQGNLNIARGTAEYVEHQACTATKN